MQIYMQKEGRLRKKRILIVDDEESIRLLLTTTLKTFDYDVDTVKSGLEAVKRIDEKVYDLIITDYRMPEMDGLELTKKIKSSHPAIPVLIITGSGPVEDFLSSGAAACITKPFNILKFRNFIKIILDKGIN